MVLHCCIYVLIYPYIMMTGVHISGLQAVGYLKARSAIGTATTVRCGLHHLRPLWPAWARSYCGGGDCRFGRWCCVRFCCLQNYGSCASGCSFSLAADQILVLKQKNAPEQRARFLWQSLNCFLMQLQLAEQHCDVHFLRVTGRRTSEHLCLQSP